MNWVAVCPECGIRTYGSKFMNVTEATAWANAWLQEHWKECSERKKGSEAEA